MDMRRLKIVALSFGLSAAMLASQDVSQALATTVSPESNLVASFWVKSKAALGGGSKEQLRARIGQANSQAVWDCASSAACRASFGKKVGPGDLERVHSILNSIRTGIKE
jgi:hypothetical protein